MQAQLTEVKAGRFVAPEIDNRARSMRSLCSMLSGERVVQFLTGVKRVQFHAMGWRELLTTPEVRAMVSQWLTGDDKADAQSLARSFRGIGFTLAEWRQVIAETKGVL